MKKIKAVLSISFLVTVAIAICMFFAFFINVLENISIGKEFNYPYFISFVVAVVASIVINVRLKRIAIKEECSEREKAAQEYWDKFRERRDNVSTTLPTFQLSAEVATKAMVNVCGELYKLDESIDFTKDVTDYSLLVDLDGNPICHKQNGVEKVYEAFGQLDKSISEHLDNPKKRSHQSRKDAFDLQKAINQGMAMYIDGKRHVNVGLKTFPATNYISVRGLSNGVLYGSLSKMDGFVYNNDGERIKGYLINV